jgi:GNAT superfamily N-acetyltransferase
VSELGSWAADPGTALADGWEPGADDTLLRTYVDGFADMCADLAELVGGRVERDETIVLADAGSPAPYLNGAVVLRPLATDEVDGVVRRAVRFFATGEGGPWVLFSALPLPRLEHLGLAPIGHPPFMIRPVGAPRREPPADLEVVVVHDEADLSRMETALRDFYPMPELIGQPPGSALRPAMLANPDYRWLLGLVDGEPVGTAMAHRRAHAVHLEWVTSDPARRGKGYGEAMTWEATLAWPDLPATLIASDAGRPTYERMGYLSVLRVTLWTGARQA